MDRGWNCLMLLPELLKDSNFLIVNNRFPHIGSKIELLWGYPEFKPFMFKLITDTRDGTRQGFPSAVSSALFQLLSIHNEYYTDAQDK